MQLRLKTKYHLKLADYFSRDGFWISKNKLGNSSSVNVLSDEPNRRAGTELFFQFMNSESFDKAKEALSDIDYLQMKVSLGMVEELVQEISYFKNLKSFSGLETIIRISSFILKENPQQLRSQLCIRNSLHPTESFELVNRLLSGSENWAPNIWLRSVNPNLLNPPSLIRRTNPHSGPISKIISLADESILATASYDGTICIHDSISASIIQVKDFKGNRIITLATDKEGNVLIAGAINGDLYFWEHYEKPDYKLLNIKSTAYSIEIINNRGLAVIGSINGVITILTLADFSIKLMAQVHKAPITGIFYIEDKDLLMSVSHDGMMIYSRLSTLEYVHSIDFKKPIDSSSKWQDSFLLTLAESNEILFITESTGEYYETVKTNCNSIKQIISVSNNIYLRGNTREFYCSDNNYRQFERIGFCEQFTFNFCVSNDNSKIYIGTGSGELLIYDIQNKENFPFGYLLREHETPVKSISWDKHSKIIASGTWIGEISLWHLDNYNLSLIKREKIHTRSVLAVNISSTSKILTSSGDGSIKYSSYPELNLIHEFNLTKFSCLIAKQSENGKYAIVLDEAGVISILNLKLLKPLRLSSRLININIRYIDIDSAFNKLLIIRYNGRLEMLNLPLQRKISLSDFISKLDCNKAVISGNGLICCIYDSVGGIYILKDNGFTNIRKLTQSERITSMAVSYNGEYLAVTSSDRTIQLFDLLTFQFSTKITIDDEPTCCTFADDISSLIVGSSFGHLYAFKIEYSFFMPQPINTDTTMNISERPIFIETLLSVFKRKRDIRQ